MQSTESKVGKPVTSMSINTEPHDDYITVNKFTGNNLHPGIPILKSVPGGGIIRKNISYNKTKCPDCGTQAHYDADSEPICPNCGMVCNGSAPARIIRDEKACGWFNDE